MDNDDEVRWRDWNRPLRSRPLAAQHAMLDRQARLAAARADALADLEHMLTLALAGMGYDDDTDLLIIEGRPISRAEAVAQFRKDMITLGVAPAELDAAGIRS